MIFLMGFVEAEISAFPDGVDCNRLYTAKLDTHNCMCSHKLYDVVEIQLVSMLAV